MIKEGLSKALSYYYPLAGKLKEDSDGKLKINCNADADGVPFLVATADCELSSLNYLDGIEVEVAKQFVFDLPSEDESGDHPLVLQVTKFSCGGFTIGMGLSHSVCDGVGAAQFFRALAELSSAKSEPSVEPVWERERLVGTPGKEPFQLPVDKAALATSPYLPATDLLHAQFYVSSEVIRRLKTSLLEECGGIESSKETFTTLEVLGAYVWRSRFRALKLNSEGKTLFTVAMGIRNLLNPPLPNGYYGNAFVAAHVVLTGGELNEAPLSKVAKLIKESKKIASTSHHITNTLCILERFRQQNIKMEASGASMALTDWRQLGLLEEVDFGWKDAVNILPLPWNMFGYVDLFFFLPPTKVDPSEKGGVRVLVCLPRAAMPKFEQEMNALKLGHEGAGPDKPELFETDKSSELVNSSNKDQQKENNS